MTILVARKRLGLRAECRLETVAASLGCVPVPNVPPTALGILTSKGRSLKGLLRAVLQTIPSAARQRGARGRAWQPAQSAFTRGPTRTG